MGLSSCGQTARSYADHHFAGIGEFHCIAEQIDQDLTQARDVSDNGLG